MPVFILSYRLSRGFVCFVHIGFLVAGCIVLPLGCVLRPRDLWVRGHRPSLNDQIEVSFLSHRLCPILSGKAVDDDAEVKPFKLTRDVLSKRVMPVENT